MTESGKWDDNRYSFPSVTLLWELFSGEGKMGVSCLLRSITSAFQGLEGEASSSLTMGTPGHTPESRKLGTGAASSGRSQDSRAGAPVIPTPGPSSRPDLDPSRACLPPAM